MEAERRLRGLRFLCCPAILALAAVLRFDALWQRGLIYWDEGKFALEGIRFQAVLSHLGTAGGAALTGKAVGTAKPTHALLIALAYTLVGGHDYAPLFLNAACSLAQIAVVYFIAMRLFGRTTALVSAVFLAVSEYDVIYARSALSESDANLLLLVGVLLWLYSDRKRPWLVVLSGFLLGLSVTANYRLVVYAGCIVAGGLIWVWRQNGWREALRVAMPWLLGAAAPLLLWQLVDLLARAAGTVLFRNELTGNPSSYLAELLYQLHGGKQAGGHVDPGPYLHWFVLRSGWLMLILVLAGIVVALWRRTYLWLMTAVLVVVPFAIYTFAPFIVARNLDAALPFAAMLSAGALVAAARLLPGRLSTALTVAIVLLLAAAGTAMTWRLTAERSGYARAAAYVERRDGGRALVSSEIMVFYLRGTGGCTAPTLRHDIYGLAAGVRAGYRYAVLDHYSWTLAQLVRSRMKRVARFPAYGTVPLGENPIVSEMDAGSRTYQPRDVDIYELDPSRLPPPGAARPDICNAERV